MKRSHSCLWFAIPLAASTSVTALVATPPAGYAQRALAQASPPPAAEVPPDEDKAKRKRRSESDAEPTKAEEERRRQERAKAEADRAGKQAEDEKQRQERAKAEEKRRDQERGKTEAERAGKRAQDEKQRQERAKAEEERREQERAKADAERGKAEAARRSQDDRAKADAARSKQAEEKARAEEEQLKKERARLEQDRARLTREREAAERERAKAAQAKTQRREQQLKQEQERLQAEEQRLKSLEDKLKQRDDRAKAERDEQRRRAEQLREREKGVRTTERRLLRLEDIQRQRQRRVEEGGRIVIEEPDSRRIVKDKGRTVIRHDETERFRLVARPGRTEQRRDGITVHFFTRTDGTEIVSEVDDDGRLIRRYRRTPQGRQLILIDNSRHYRRDRPFFQVSVNLLPPVVRIPRERYIVEYSSASEDDLYEALQAPPVERLGRTYSLDEIRYTEELRARMRRIDLDEINFEFGSWEVPPDQLPKLERLARAINRLLRRSPSEVVLIEGYTDAVGSEEDNLTLSDRRAESVAVILSEEFGVPPENLVTQGYGEQFLKVETEGPEQVNRRVAVRRITPILSQTGS